MSPKTFEVLQFPTTEGPRPSAACADVTGGTPPSATEPATPVISMDPAGYESRPSPRYAECCARLTVGRSYFAVQPSGCCNENAPSRAAVLTHRTPWAESAAMQQNMTASSLKRFQPVYK